MVRRIINAVILAEERRRDPVCWSKVIEVTNAKGSDGANGSTLSNTGRDINDLAPIAALRTMIESLGRIKENWTRLATELGWTKPAGEIGELRQSSADYVLTDGIGFSEPPTSAMLGLRPVVAASNLRYTGWDRREVKHFNAKGSEFQKMDVYPMPVRGYMGSALGEDSLTRKYVPASEWMGEPDVEEMFAQFLADDTFGQKVVRVWAARATSYVGLYWTGPNPPQNKLPGATLTDWEAYVITPQKSETVKNYEELYKSDLKPIEQTMFFYRSIWYHRTPMRNSRIGDVEFYDEFGNFAQTLEQDGYVFFGAPDVCGQTEVNVSGESLQALVDAMPISPTNERPPEAISEVGTAG
jgi:hypothetical protein